MKMIKLLDGIWPKIASFKYLKQSILFLNFGIPGRVPIIIKKIIF